MATKQDTFEKLVELQHMMGALHHRHMAEHGPLGDPTRGRGRVLALLKMKDGIATRDMANILGIRVSSLNETLARLEAQGYVERRPSEQDGRIMLVFLTDKGREAEQPHADFGSMLFQGFEDAEIDALDGFLTRMGASMERELGADWRDQMEHARRRREQIFHQAGNGGHEHGHGAGHGHHRTGTRRHEQGHGRGHGGGRGGEPHARTSPVAEQQLCDHNCRACTRTVCARHQR